MKTQAEAGAYIATQKLPPGWRIEARVLRTFRWRSMFSLRLYHNNDLIKAFAYYQVEPAVRSMVATAERETRGQIVTTDLNGWVTSWEDAS